MRGRESVLGGPQLEEHLDLLREGHGGPDVDVEGGLLFLAGAAATAAVSAPVGVALVSTNFLVRGNVRTLLFFMASLDGIVGIVALQLVYSWFRPSQMVVGLVQDRLPDQMGLRGRRESHKSVAC